MADCWIQFASPVRHPPSPVWNLYVQSATAVIDKRCIAGTIVNFHCVLDEQRWRIAGSSPSCRTHVLEHRIYPLRRSSLTNDVPHCSHHPDRHANCLGCCHCSRITETGATLF